MVEINRRSSESISPEIAEKFPQVNRLLDWFVFEGESNYPLKISAKVREYLYSNYYEIASREGVEIMPANELMNKVRILILDVAALSEDTNHSAQKAAIDALSGNFLDAAQKVKPNRWRISQMFGVGKLIIAANLAEHMDIDRFIDSGTYHLSHAIVLHSPKRK